MVRSFQAYRRPLAIGLTYVVLYVLLDWVSYVYPVLPLGITPWNPPPGLSLFLLLGLGLRYWPWLLPATALADLVVRGAPSHGAAAVLSAMTVTAGYSLAAAVLVRRLRIRTSLDTARDLAWFLAVVVMATLAIAVLYVAIHYRAGAIPADQVAANVFQLWIGDLNGILVLTPALLVHAGRRRNLSRREFAEVALQTAVLVLALWAVFGAADKHTLFYPLFLPLVWVAARWGLPGATLALAASQLGLLAAVTAGGHPSATFVQLQFLMLTLCVTGLVLGAVVTHRASIEVRLRDRQVALDRALRYASIGEMTSAIAHELNQPMSALSRYLGACEVLLRTPEQNREALLNTMAKAVAEARRAGDVVSALRDFFRSGRLRPQQIPAARIAEDAASAARDRCAQAGVTLVLDITDGLPDLEVDPLQIETALHNLLANAIDAVRDGAAPERRVTLAVGRQGSLVTFAVSDSGPGIAPDLVPHLFEPFRSTKDDGMGLGLAISRTLVEAHGGMLNADFTPGRGARFVLTLPAVGANLRAAA